MSELGVGNLKQGVEISDKGWRANEKKLLIRRQSACYASLVLDVDAPTNIDA